MQRRSGLGCGGLIAVLLIVGLVIQYWYLVAAVIFIAGGVWYYYHKQQQEADQRQAAIEQQEKDEAHQREIEGSKADQIQRYKQLLDDGAITQEEFNQLKAHILGRDDDLNY
jgi:uncharacterized protein HemX